MAETGVNVVGFLRTELGQGEAARRNAAAADATAVLLPALLAKECPAVEPIG